MRTVIPVGLLVFQLVMISYARFVPSRYFCWAPFDMQTEYHLKVTVKGRELSAAEIRKRYRRPQHGSDNRSPQHVIDMVQGYEERYAQSDQANVVMKYRVNGKEQQEWRWPQPPSRP